MSAGLLCAACAPVASHAVASGNWLIGAWFEAPASCEPRAAPSIYTERTLTLSDEEGSDTAAIARYEVSGARIVAYEENGDYAVFIRETPDRVRLVADIRAGIDINEQPYYLLSRCPETGQRLTVRAQRGTAG